MAQPENGIRLGGRFRFREPIVLLPIICLTFITATIAAAQQRRLHSQPISYFQFFNLCQFIVPVPMVVLVAFLSELNGRKPIFMVLFTFEILTSILAAVSGQEVCDIIGYVIGGVVRGGSLTMTYLAISEYCNPKHRFAYLIANAAVSTIGGNSAHMLFNENILDEDTIHIQVFGGVLGAVCLGLVCVWPESPYWLFGKGRLEEGRQAFLWLHGEGSQDELSSLSKERRRRGPLRLFWMSLFVAILSISMRVMADCQNVILMFMARQIIDFQGKPISIGSIFAVVCIIALVSYKINRKIIFLATCLVSLVFNYIVALCLYLLSPESLAVYVIFSIFYVLSTCGPNILSMSLFIEIIPQKYNTHMSCICVVFYYISNFIVINAIVMGFDSVPYYFFTILFTTLSLCALFIIYFLAPETKGKTLLEIQRSYAPQQSNVNTGQNEIMLQSVQS